VDSERRHCDSQHLVCILSVTLLPRSLTLLLSCTSAISKEPTLFPSPETFNPDRFLNTDEPRLIDFTLPFGFGRRICPGIHVASQSIFIIAARYVPFSNSIRYNELTITSSILHTFNISPHPAIGVPHADEFTGQGIVRRPMPFQFVSTPRSQNSLKVIMEEAAEAGGELKDWK